MNKIFLLKKVSNTFLLNIRITAFSILLFAFLSDSLNLAAQNNALDFNGSNDVVLPYNPATDFSLNSKFTIETWFKTTDITAVLYSNKVDQMPFIGHEVAIVNNFIVFEVMNNYFSNTIRIETINTYNDGNWHHVACVYKGIPNASNCDIYVDGILQTVNVTHNNLTSSANSGNAPRIGSRNGSAYFLNGVLDELRIWNKALCAAEIQSRRNCELMGNEANLLAYFNFNQGVAGGNNLNVTSLTDISGNNNVGSLNNFVLTGNTSNWINSSANITGSCNYNGPIAIVGSPTMCAGSTNVLTANGANSYTWSNTSNGSSLAVSPTITTIYSVTGTNTQNGCYGSSTFTQTVLLCSGLSSYSTNNELVVFPNPGHGKYKLKRSFESDLIVEIYNSVGALMNSFDVKENEQEINIENLNSGIYFFIIKQNNSIIKNIKIIKE